MNSDVMTDVIIVMKIRMQNHKCNEVENVYCVESAKCCDSECPKN